MLKVMTTYGKLAISGSRNASENGGGGPGFGRNRALDSPNAATASQAKG